MAKQHHARNVVFSSFFVVFLTLPVMVEAQQWSAQGVIVPYHDATLSVTVSGAVARVLVKEGERVTAGQPVIQLRDTLQTLEAKRYRLIWRDQTAVDEARQRYATYSKQLSTTRALYLGTQSVSKESLQTEELKVKLAELEVQRLIAAQDKAKVEYQIAEAQLKERTIRAPFDGIVGKISVQVGDICSPGQPVARIVQVSKCKLVVHMDAVTSRQLHVGMPMYVIVTGYGPRTVFDASIDYVAPVVDSSSGLREVKAEFENPGDRVLPGLTAILEPR